MPIWAFTKINRMDVRSVVMKYTPILLLVVVVACEKKDDTLERALKARACMTLYFDIDHQVDRFVDDARLSSKPEVMAVIEDVKKIVAWRKNFYKLRSNESLLVYTDSVLTRYKKIERKDNGVIHYIDKGKALLTAVDSTARLDLLYWTLTAEAALHLDYAYQFPGGDRFFGLIPTYMDRKEFVIGDTVLVFVELHFRRFDNILSLDFSELECRNQTTGEVVHARVTDAGAMHVLRYIPRTAGKYAINGKVKIGNEDLESGMKLYEDFTVK